MLDYRGMRNPVYYGYARVSTAGQNDTSIEVQLEYLRLQAEALEMAFFPRSEKKSGKDVVGREVFTTLLDEAVEGDVVGVYDNSRLGRDTAENLSIIKSLSAKGVQVQINGKFVDPDNPDDELFFSIQSSISTFQRKSQLMKSRAGINLKKQSGDWVLRGDLYGYKIVRSGKSVRAEVIEDQAEAIKLMFEEYAKGHSVNRVTQILNQSIYKPNKGGKFLPASVRRTLLKPIYMGYYFMDSGIQQNIRQYSKTDIQENMVKSNIYTPIVSEDLWWKVFDSYRGLRRTHTRQFEYRFSYYELSSVIKCAYCGAGYVHSVHKYKDRDSYLIRYVCNVHKTRCGQEIFGKPADSLEAVMRATMYLTFADSTELSEFFAEKRLELNQSIEATKKAVSELESQIAELDQRKSKLIDAIETGAIEIGDVKDRLNTIDEDRKFLEDKKRTLSYALSTDEQDFYDLVDETKEEELDEFRDGEPPIRRRKYLALTESVLLYKDKLVARYKNSKTFVIWLEKNIGKRLQKDFRINVAYKGKLQYKCVYNEPNNTIKMVPMETNGDEFLDYYNRFFQQSIDKLGQYFDEIT